MGSSKAVFALILVLAFFLRLFTLDKYETWDDEKLSVQEANGFLNFNFKNETPFTYADLKSHNTVSNVIASNINGDGGNGILYILLLHFWSAIFSNTDFSVRFLSLLLGLLVTIAAYRLSWDLFKNKRTALVVMTLIAIHPFLITYSQEARTYMLATLLTLTATSVLFKIIHATEVKWTLLLMYASTTSAAILSHYSTIYIFIAHFIICLCYTLNLKQWARLVVTCLVSIGLVMIWVIAYGFNGLTIIAAHNELYEQLAKKNLSDPFYLAATPYTVGIGWFQNLLFIAGNTFVLLGFHIRQVAILLIIPILLLLTAFRNTAKSQFRQLCVLLLLSTSSLFYATVLASISGHLIPFQQLYSLFSVPYLCILLGYAIRTIVNRKSKNITTYLSYALVLTQIAIMLCSTLLIYNGLDSNTKTANKFESAADSIIKRTNTETQNFTIVYNSIATAMEVNKYLDNTVANKIQIIRTTHSDTAIYLQYPQNKIVILKKPSG